MSLNYNAQRAIDLVKVHQSLTSMKSQLEHHYTSSHPFMNYYSAVGGIDSLITEIENELNRLIP